MAVCGATEISGTNTGGFAAKAAGARHFAYVSVAGHVAAKVIAAVAITATLATGVAAATGILPDPIQSRVADLVDGIGIHLPRPEDVIPTLPTTVPDLDTLPLPGVTVPVVTLP